MQQRHLTKCALFIPQKKKRVLNQAKQPSSKVKSKLVREAGPKPRLNYNYSQTTLEEATGVCQKGWQRKRKT